MYISGMPGTGKTATTLEVIRKIISAKKINGKKTPLFDFIHINAMSLTNPNLVYTILADRVIDKKMSPSSAALFLEEFFKAKEADKDRIV
jgi:Cdc6-like AAA superfamily ATPase